MMPGEYRRATGIVGSLGLVLIGANGVLLLAGSSASEGCRFTILIHSPWKPFRLPVGRCDWS